MTLKSLYLGRERDTSADDLQDTLVTEALELKHTSAEYLITLSGKWQIQSGSSYVCISHTSYLQSIAVEWECVLPNGSNSHSAWHTDIFFIQTNFNLNKRDRKACSSPIHNPLPSPMAQRPTFTLPSEQQNTPCPLSNRTFTRVLGSPTPKYITLESLLLTHIPRVESPSTSLQKASSTLSKSILETIFPQAPVPSWSLKQGHRVKNKTQKQGTKKDNYIRDRTFKLQFGH